MIFPYSKAISSCIHPLVIPLRTYSSSKDSALKLWEPISLNSAPQSWEAPRFSRQPISESQTVQRYTQSFFASYPFRPLAISKDTPQTLQIQNWAWNKKTQNHLLYYPVQFLSSLGWRPISVKEGAKDDVVLYFNSSSFRNSSSVSKAHQFSKVIHTLGSTLVIESQTLAQKKFQHSLEESPIEWGDSILVLRKIKNLTLEEHEQDTLRVFFEDQYDSLLDADKKKFSTPFALPWVTRRILDLLAMHNEEMEISPKNPTAYPNTSEALIQETTSRQFYKHLEIFYMDRERYYPWRFLTVCNGSHFDKWILEKLPNLSVYRSHKSMPKQMCFDYIFSKEPWYGPCSEERLRGDTMAFLEEKNWTRIPLSSCAKGDIIIYYDSKEKPFNSRHTGRIHSIENSVIMVESKFGFTNVMLHEISTTPAIYGDSIACLRPPISRV